MTLLMVMFALAALAIPMIFASRVGPNNSPDPTAEDDSRPGGVTTVSEADRYAQQQQQTTPVQTPRPAQPQQISQQQPAMPQRQAPQQPQPVQTPPQLPQQPPGVATEPVQGQQQQMPGWLRQFQQLTGVDLSGAGSEEAAVRQLASAMQQAAQNAQMAHYGQQLLPYASEINQLIAQRQAAQQQQQQQQNRLWNAPEWNDEWLAGLERDPQTGQIRAKIGWAPDLPSRYEAYQNWQAQTLTKLLRNPFEVLGPGIQQTVQGQIQQYVAQQIQALREDLQAQSILQQNPWLFERDQTGATVYGTQGKPVLSAQGRIYQANLRRLEQHGIRDPQTQHELAVQLTAAQLGQAQGATQAGQQQQAYQPQAPQQPPGVPQQPWQPQAGWQLEPSTGVNRIAAYDSEAQVNGQGMPRKSLGERLNESFDRAGLTDQNFAG